MRRLVDGSHVHKYEQMFAPARLGGNTCCRVSEITCRFRFRPQQAEGENNKISPEKTGSMNGAGGPCMAEETSSLSIPAGTG